MVFWLIWTSQREEKKKEQNKTKQKKINQEKICLAIAAQQFATAERIQKAKALDAPKQKRKMCTKVQARRQIKKLTELAPSDDRNKT